ncbi:WhiB family transcriptional regulator [Streptomyces sp. SBC-4]|nr:WhiB family transcriptional regulator [Streptomyces sp. SBC-4]MDV5145886.1 WhiB family transcriptional regulator [Streptomyces sp. SBC-4]
MTSTLGTSAAQNLNWRDHAMCRGQDPELWFPRSTNGQNVAQAEDAKKICRSCPVAIACAQWAIERRSMEGIWGGLGEKQRLRIARAASADGLTAEQVAQLVKETWARDAQDKVRNLYLRNSTQGDDGHVWWRGRKTSYTVAGRVLTPGQIAFEVGRGHVPAGHVKATCGQPFCVAAEHLADGADRWQRDHASAA